MNLAYYTIFLRFNGRIRRIFAALWFVAAYCWGRDSSSSWLGRLEVTVSAPRLIAGTISGPALTSTSTSLPSRARARMPSKRHGRSFAHSFPFQLPTSRSFTSSQVQSAQRLSMPAMRFSVGSWKLKTRPSRVR